MSYPKSISETSPYTEITFHNIEQLTPQIIEKIENSTFVALDMEFSGLGSNLFADNISDRYEACKASAQKFAVLSMGLSLFKCTDKKKPSRWIVDNFGFLLCNENNYTVSPNSLRFLVENGFDIHRQVLNGIQYRPGTINKNDKKSVHPHNSLLRLIFKAITKVPLVLHNGFTDLVFLYHSFYNDLPNTLDTFVADISDLMVEVWDTKYISEYLQQERTTFLEWLFKKFERKQYDLKESLFKLMFSKPLTSTKHEEISPEVPSKRKSDDVPYCEDFASYGYCRKNRECKKSHNVDYIMDYQRSKSMKTDLPTPQPPPFMNTSIQALPSNPSAVSTSHMAHIDSFMTGYIFLYQLCSIPLNSKHLWQTERNKMDRNNESQEDHSNKLFLSKKDFPLRLEKSAYAAYSTRHLTSKSRRDNE